MVGGVCVAFARHVQLSWVVWHRRWGGLGVCMVQCWCSVSRMCCRSVVILGWVTVRRVEHRVLTRCSRGGAGRGEVCAHPGLDGAVVSQDKDSTVKVILLGGEGWCVDGDV